MKYNKIRTFLINIKNMNNFDELYLEILNKISSPKIITTYKGFEGKIDPTQYNSKENIIYVKPSYNQKSDPEGWMVHEYSHADSNAKGIKDDNKQYPTNNIEILAYTKQFKWLKETGKCRKFKDLKDVKKFPTLAQKFTRYDGEYEPILKKCWDNA